MDTSTYRAAAGGPLARYFRNWRALIHAARFRAGSVGAGLSVSTASFDDWSFGLQLFIDSYDLRARLSSMRRAVARSMQTRIGSRLGSRLRNNAVANTMV